MKTKLAFLKLAFLFPILVALTLAPAGAAVRYVNVQNECYENK